MKRFTLFFLLGIFILSFSFSETLYVGDKLRAFSVSEDLHKNTIYLSSVKPSSIKDYYEITFYVIVTPAGKETLEGTHTYPVTFVAKKGDELFLKNNVWSYPETIIIEEIGNNQISFKESENNKERKQNEDTSVIQENLDWFEKNFVVTKIKTKSSKEVSAKIQLGFIRNDKATQKLINDKDSHINKVLNSFFAELDEDSLKIENRNDLKIRIKNAVNEKVFYSQRIVAVMLTDFSIQE